MASELVRRDQCGLCGKKKEQVRKLIVGLHGSVCSDCIDLCGDILRNEAVAKDRPAPAAAPRADGSYVLEIPPDIALSFPEADEIVEILRILAFSVEHRAQRLYLNESLVAETAIADS